MGVIILVKKLDIRTLLDNAQNLLDETIRNVSLGIVPVDELLQYVLKLLECTKTTLKDVFEGIRIPSEERESRRKYVLNFVPKLIH